MNESPYPPEKRCESCLGMGYKGRNRQTAHGKAWKLETCRTCGGTGSKRIRMRVLARVGAKA